MRSHSLAPSILFYRTLTLTTLLRIALDPVCGFAVILTFLQPQLCDTAYYRPMVAVNVAAKTEQVVLRGTAVYGRNHRHKSRLSCRGGAGDRERAARVRAELEVLVVPNKVADNQLLISYDRHSVFFQ